MRISDWSSDVCSSDLDAALLGLVSQDGPLPQEAAHAGAAVAHRGRDHAAHVAPAVDEDRIERQPDGPSEGVDLRQPGAAPITFGRLHGRHIAGPASHGVHGPEVRSEEHTSELQSLMRISYAVFCLKKKKKKK